MRRTCDQVGQSPHRALQLSRGRGVSLHVVGVALIDPLQLVGEVFNGRHVRFTRHTRSALIIDLQIDQLF